MGIKIMTVEESIEEFDKCLSELSKTLIAIPDSEDFRHLKEQSMKNLSDALDDRLKLMLVRDALKKLETMKNL